MSDCSIRTLHREPARWMPVALVLIVWLAVMLPSLAGGFLADDWFQVRERPWSEVIATFAGDWNRGERGGGTGFYRPLVRLSFAIDGMLYGRHPMGYHLTNSMLLLALLAAAYRCGIILSNGRRWTTALLTAWIAASPLMIEPLFWLSGRTDLIAATLVLWSLWWTLRAVESPTTPRVSAALGFLAAALAAKEVAVAGVLIIPATVWLLRPARPWSVAERVLALGPFALLALYALLRRVVIGGIGGYYGSRTSELELGTVLVNLQAMLGALLMPDLSGYLGYYVPWLGLLWLTVAVPMLVFYRCSRRMLLLIGAVLLSLLPMAGIRISPWDGARVLLLALVFQNLALGVLASRVLSWSRLAAWPFALVVAVMIFAGVIAASAAGKDHGRWARITSDLVEESWTHVRSTPAGTVLVAQEPVHRMARPIFTPGLSMFLALQSRASLDGYAAEITDGRLMITGADVAVELFPSLGDALADPRASGRRIEVLPPLQETLENTEAEAAGLWQWFVEDPRANRTAEPTFLRTEVTPGLTGEPSARAEVATFRATPDVPRGWWVIEVEGTGDRPFVFAEFPHRSGNVKQPDRFELLMVLQDGDRLAWRLALPRDLELTEFAIRFEFPVDGAQFHMTNLRAQVHEMDNHLFPPRFRRGE